MQTRLNASPQARAKAELEKRRRKTEGCAGDSPPNGWAEWLRALFPVYVKHPFAQRHVEFWEWLDSILPEQRPRPFVAPWPRGGAKSSSAELGVVRVGAKGVRRYVWYVSGTQDKADAHVENIAALLESQSVSKFYPELGSRLVGKYGNSKGWRRSRLRTASGFTVDSLGLDTGARGVKIEDTRPDMIIFDDVDELHDSLAITSRKMETITKSILPSGAAGCAVLFIQNLIHPNSIASQLVDGRADFIADRYVSGPHPAIENAEYEQREGKNYIVRGTPTWAGQSIEVCQNQIFDWGFSAFKQEAQHEVDNTGGIWSGVEWQRIERKDLPSFVRLAVWVDPAVTTTDHSDSMGIGVGGLTKDNKLIGLYWWEGITTPEDAIERAIRKAIEWGCDTVGVETDQGGDTWQSVFSIALNRVKSEIIEAYKKDNPSVREEDIPLPRLPSFKSDKAGAGYGSKIERNSRMLTSYENGEVLHMIGTHAAIEKSLRRFPSKPLDLADAWFWVWNDLKGGKSGSPYGFRKA